MTEAERTKAAASHKVTVIYTTDDDGIHVCCETCGFAECLGYDPTPTQVMECGRRHDEQVQQQKSA